MTRTSLTACGGNILGCWQHNISSASSWDLQLYYDDNHYNEILLDQYSQTIDLDFQYNFQEGQRHDLIWGLGYRAIIDKFDDSQWASIEPDSRTAHLYSAFVQDEINLMPDRLWLTLGIKYEHNDYTGNELQPSARLRWQPLEHHTFWAAVSRAVRTPSRIEDSGEFVFTVVPPPPSAASDFLPRVYGNSKMDAEELIAYEAGYRYHPGSTFYLDFSAFYNDYNELRSVEATSDPEYLSVDNQLEGNTYGLEVAANWQPQSWLNFNLAYSYIELDLERSSEQTLANQMEATESSSPRHQVSLRTGLDLSCNLRLNLWGRYVDELHNSSFQAIMLDQGVDNYLTLDANLIWQPQSGLEFMLAGKNIFDSRHLEFIDEGFVPPTEIERSIYGKITWKY